MRKLSLRGRLTLRQSVAIAAERRLWDRRASSWDDAGSSGLVAIVEAVLDACEPSTGTVAVDLGCGTGRVTIPLAARCERVLGVDVSARSIELLQAKCAAAGVDNIDAFVEPLETLTLAPGSVDLVVSNYALHHLHDRDKARLLSAALDWLRPRGRLVVGDMMFGRGGSSGDRRIVASKLQVLMRRGPQGWWRILKNLWRFGLRMREKPLARARWEALARAAGFAEVRTVPIRAEASLLLAIRERERAVPDAEPTVRAARSPSRTGLGPRAGSPPDMIARGSVGRALAAAALALVALTGCGAAARHVSAGAHVSAAKTSPRRPTTTAADPPSGTTIAAAATQRPHRPAYPVVSRYATPGSRWRAVVSVAGRTAVWVTQRDGVTMLRFDQHVGQLVLHAGSVDPGGGPWRHGDAVVGSERPRLIAAFNSGFKLDTGAGGWRSGAHTAVPLATGRASIVTYRDGVTDIGAWGAGVPARRPIASVRQNLLLLIDHGVAASDVSSCIETCWGATVGGVLSVARSALGIDARGRLIYGAAESATPATLAQGLIEGGVRRAAELDINPDWVAAYLYRHHRHGPPRYVPVIPGQYGVYGQFLLPYSRDFFAVVSR